MASWEWPKNLVGWMKFGGAVVAISAIITIYANLPLRVNANEEDIQSLNEIANYFKGIYESEQMRQQTPQQMYYPPQQQHYPNQGYSQPDCYDPYYDQYYWSNQWGEC